MVLPVRDIRVMYALKSRHYQGFRREPDPASPRIFRAHGRAGGERRTPAIRRCRIWWPGLRPLPIFSPRRPRGRATRLPRGAPSAPGHVLQHAALAIDPDDRCRCRRRRSRLGGACRPTVVRPSKASTRRPRRHAPPATSRRGEIVVVRVPRSAPAGSPPAIMRGGDQWPALSRHAARGVDGRPTIAQRAAMVLRSVSQASGISGRVVRRWRRARQSKAADPQPRQAPPAASADGQHAFGHGNRRDCQRRDGSGNVFSSTSMVTSCGAAAGRARRRRLGMRAPSHGGCCRGWSGGQGGCRGGAVRRRSTRDRPCGQAADGRAVVPRATRRRGRGRCRGSGAGSWVTTGTSSAVTPTSSSMLSTPSARVAANPEQGVFRETGRGRRDGLAARIYGSWRMRYGRDERLDVKDWRWRWRGCLGVLGWDGAAGERAVHAAAHLC